MTKPSTPKQNRRRRKTIGRVATKPLVNYTLADTVANRVDGIEVPSLPWDQKFLTLEQARAEGLFTRKEFAEKLKVKPITIQTWIKRFEDFPEPKAILINDGAGSNAYLYSAKEVAEWVKSKRSNGLILTFKRYK